MKGVAIKVYAWLSGILVAFIMSYVTGVISEVVPAPKLLMCKLSLGFCPPAMIVSFGATDIDKIVDREGVGQGAGQHQIGMLHNRTDPNMERSNMVKYRFDSGSTGNYKFRIYYASASKRPIQIFINDIKVSLNALNKSTGGWENKDREWSQEYDVVLKDKNNHLMLKSKSIFPHLSKFNFVQVP